MLPRKQQTPRGSGRRPEEAAEVLGGSFRVDFDSRGRRGGRCRWIFAREGKHVPEPFHGPVSFGSAAMVLRRVIKSARVHFVNVAMTLKK